MGRGLLRWVVENVVRAAVNCSLFTVNYGVPSPAHGEKHEANALAALLAAARRGAC